MEGYAPSSGGYYFRRRGLLLPKTPSYPDRGADFVADGTSDRNPDGNADGTSDRNADGNANGNADGNANGNADKYPHDRKANKYPHDRKASSDRKAN